MEKSNLELFKQALDEAWDSKIRQEIGDFTEEIVTSERHKAIMKAILEGTYEEGKNYGEAKKCEEPKKQSPWRLTRAKVAAILVAAAVLLASCAIVYRNEIRDFVEEIFEDFCRVTYSGDDADGGTIEDVYELTYVPEGYVLEKEITTPSVIRYEFTKNNDTIVFEQFVLDYSSFLFDIENGYNLLLNNNNIDVYYKNTSEYHFYLWNDGKHSLLITSIDKISNEEIQAIINNLKIK